MREGNDEESLVVGFWLVELMSAYVGVNKALKIVKRNLTEVVLALVL